MGYKTKKKRSQNKTKKQFNKLNCSPKREHTFSCYDTEVLYKIKNIWNQTYSDKIILTNDPKKIWEQVKNYLIDDCENEKCWLDQDFLKDKVNKNLKVNAFAPLSPKKWKINPTEWLSSTDIINVMRQYEKKYKYYEFLGPSPIDFDLVKKDGQCVWESLCKFDLKNYIDRGKNKIGIIFNTDPHYLGGSHWICVFIDIEKQYVYYFDSTGDSVPEEVDIFIKNVIKQGKALGINLKYFKNKTAHQKGDTECGMYVLVTIILLLKNKREPKDFNKRIKDADMVKIRKIIFN